VFPTIYQNTATSANISTGSRGTQAVSCNAGDKLVGGGCTMGGAAVRITKSYPTTDAEWSCSMENNTGSNQQITAYVVCADIA